MVVHFLLMVGDFQVRQRQPVLGRGARVVPITLDQVCICCFVLCFCTFCCVCNTAI